MLMFKNWKDGMNKQQLPRDITQRVMDLDPYSGIHDTSSHYWAINIINFSSADFSVG